MKNAINLMVTLILVAGTSAQEQPTKDKPRQRGTYEKPSFSAKPLTEMGADDKYKGEDGGLYGGGKNEPPEAHAAAAKKEAAMIQPLDADGKPSKDGKIALISISMSNWTAEFSMFKQVADKDPDKSPLLTIVDCAQGNQTMTAWANPKGPWSEVLRRMDKYEIKPTQVQIVWIKVANFGKGGLEEYARTLQKDLQATVQNAKALFPNLRIAYLESRIYGGWGTFPNPEPLAYEGAFAIRWLIQDQIKAAWNSTTTQPAARSRRRCCCGGPTCGPTD